MSRRMVPAGSNRAGPQQASAVPRVFFVHDIGATFVQKDLALLRTFCEVTPLLFRGPRDYFRLIKGLLRCDIVYCWFALDFAAVAVVLAKFTGRGSIVASGGWDVARFKEIGYGRLLRRRGRIAARIACSIADLVLAFSDWSAERVREVAPTSRVRRAYLGVDLDTFWPGPKEDLVLCVANINRENIERKGLRTFVRAASSVPEAKFLLIGRWWDEAADELRDIAPSNVTLTGWLAPGDLREVFSRAKVYCQASYTEGFGLAVAEAMASGCVPVVCRTGALPEVVGETGLYVPYGDESSLAIAIREALRSPHGSEARDRVRRFFPEEGRREELRVAIEDVRRNRTRAAASFAPTGPAAVHRVKR